MKRPDYYRVDHALLRAAIRSRIKYASLRVFSSESLVSPATISHYLNRKIETVDMATFLKICYSLGHHPAKYIIPKTELADGGKPHFINDALLRKDLLKKKISIKALSEECSIGRYAMGRYIRGDTGSGIIKDFLNMCYVAGHSPGKYFTPSENPIKSTAKGHPSSKQASLSV